MDKTQLNIQHVLGIEAFLREYPRMAIKPTPACSLTLSGSFDFRANLETRDEIIDSYHLTIEVPDVFPRGLPLVTETGNKIPHDGEHHVNPDGTLCLGSPLRLLLEISRTPTLNGFAGKILVPYLYAFSHTLKFGGKPPFGELEHGAPGELRDYADLLGLKEPEQAGYALSLLAMRRRQANKCECPCGCGRRIGKCPFNDRLDMFRALSNRSWFRELNQVRRT